MKIQEVVMIRHAQSTWNAEGRFSGWSNPPLTSLGIAEADKAARALNKAGYRFDRVFTSYLQRADVTARIILAEMNQKIEIEKDWRLNERHYGDLQGRSRQELINKVGEHQVWRWRRGYKDTAPALAAGDPRHPALDPQYSDLTEQQLPNVESLADTRKRVVEFWQERVAPQIASNQRVLISAHGNTLRALIMDLANMSEEEVEQFEIPTATPIIYRFDENGKPLGWNYLNSMAA